MQSQKKLADQKRERESERDKPADGIAMLQFLCVVVGEQKPKRGESDREREGEALPPPTHCYCCTPTGSCYADSGKKRYLLPLTIINLSFGHFPYQRGP